MEPEPPPTVESFYRFCSQKKLMGVRCESCKAVVVPPRSLCPKCDSTDLRWIELTGTGRLLTYSVVHVAPPVFQSSVPYAVGIVQLTEGSRLPAIIRSDLKNLEVGMPLKVAFEPSGSQNWPSWMRYYFIKDDLH